MRKQIIQFDLQRNSFYKINKDTGQSFFTYKNGDPLKKFKPDITGIDYHLRKITKTNEIKKQGEENQNRLFEDRKSNYLQKLKQQISHHHSNHHKAIDYSPKSRKSTDLSYFSIQNSTSSPFEKHAEKQKSKEKVKHLFLEEPKNEKQQKPLSKQKSQEKVKRDLFNQTITKYTKLMKEKPCENNSPKKDIPASQTAKDPLDTLCTTIQSFNYREPCWEKQHLKPNHRKNATIDALPDDYSPLSHQRKEKKLFYRFHPQFIVKENQKSIEVQKQRKRNMRMLEKLFIRQNNKIEDKIFE